MEPQPERLEQSVQDLLDSIQLIEDIAGKIQGLGDEREILRSIVGQSERGRKCLFTVFLLDEDGVHLRPMPAADSPAVRELRARAQQAGVAPLTQFAVNVDTSPIWRAVIREKKTVQHTVAEVVRDLFPPHVADLILSTPGRAARMCLLSPLEVNDRVIGALEIGCPAYAEYMLPSVRSMARHIGLALARTRAEAELRRQEGLLNTLLNAPGHPMFLLDLNATILAANEAFARGFGKTVAEVVGRCVHDLLPTELARQRWSYVEEVIRTGLPVYFEDERAGRAYAHSVCPIRDEQGRVTQVAVFAQDITEPRRLSKTLLDSETRFRQMAEVMPAMFWMVAPDRSKLLYVSSAVENIYGHPCEAFYANPALWREMLHPDDRDRVIAAWHESFGRASDMEYRIVRSDGQVRWVRDVARPVQSETGEVTMLTGYVEDITERKLAEARVIQDEKLNALGVLAGGIAHGLRNPLGVISACAQMMRDSPTDRDLQRQCVSRILVATKRASELVDSVLSFARPKDLQTTIVDVREALQHCLTLFGDHLLLQRVELQLNVPAGLRVRGNQELLEEVFASLVVNACNAMPSGGVLSISGRREGTGWIVLRFRDTGRGIRPEHLTKVFDPFFTTMPVGKGTGLGLTIARTIITQHGGTIEAESDYGHGATFIIRLPAARPTESQS